MNPIYSWIDTINFPSLTLAYIGDGVYEMAIRCYLLKQGIRKPEELHHKAVEYVKGHVPKPFLP